LTATNKPSHTGHGIGIDISPLVKPIIAFISFLKHFLGIRCLAGWRKLSWRR
jgi:hypothetical protein